MGGMVLETNRGRILEAVDSMNQLDKGRADSSTIVTVGQGGKMSLHKRK